MRIAHEKIDIQTNPRFSTRAIMSEMQQLFGGRIQRQPGHGLLGGSHAPQILQTREMIAVTNAIPNAVTVYPAVSERAGAAAWTALQAYLAKGGTHLTHLSIEASGQPGYREWVAQKGPEFTDAIQVAQGMYFITKIAAAKLNDPGASKAADEAFFEDIRRPLEVAGSPNFFATKPDPNSKPELLTVWEDTTLFHALGDSLPETAHAMAEGYGELIGNEENAATQVAQALGASSLAGLTDAWNWAMTHNTSFEAGQSMLRDLAIENY